MSNGKKSTPTGKTTFTLAKEEKSSFAAASSSRKAMPHAPSDVRPGHPGREPDDDSCEGAERPNPCVPESKRDECHCPKTPGTPDRPSKPARPKARTDECCKQLIDMLSRVPGLELPQPHKPKQRPARKVQSLCDTIGIAEAILPALTVLWDRHQAAKPGRNDFETKVQAIFANLDKPKHAGMEAGFNGYNAMRKSGKGECLFNDCLANAGLKGAIEKNWFAEVLLREGLQFAGQIVFSGSGGVMGPGQVRLWDNVVNRGPNGSGATIYQGPWPWLTSICPDVSSYEELGNTKSFRPAPGTSHIWQNYQYAQTCTFTPNPSGSIVATCERQHPPPPPPNALFTSCEGGFDYTHNNDCLRIPTQRPGGSIKLRGFNFITPTVKVRFTWMEDRNVFFEEDCRVWGDRETPLKDAQNHFIVDERVRDWINVQIKSSHPTQPGAPLPPGLYEVTVRVANITNAIYDSSTPPTLVTNALLLRIEPDTNIKYLLWSERGRCNRETPGMGDDEIWWDAFVGHVVPNAVPVPPFGASGMELKGTEHRPFPRQPWEDMDDGEGAGAYSRDIFGPAPFELGGVVAIAIIGFEVDDEDAAKSQLQGFADAYWHALKNIAGVAIAGEGLAGTLAKIANATLTQALVALAIVAAVILIAAAFWAAWAPADLIALDLFTLDALSAWHKTDPNKPLSPEASRFFADELGRESIAAAGTRLVTVTQRALPRLHKPGDAAATWVQENQYDTPEDGEDASYTLEFRLARS